MVVNMLREFFRLEAAGGILLICAAALALLVVNTPVGPWYTEVLELRVALIAGTFSLDKPLLLWINDGLMAVFFLLIGLELKREILEGQLSNRSQLVLPLLAASGGLIVPALFYWFVNRHDPLAMNGWAIPTATDIAFALGILSLLGSRVPLSLKLFLTAIAIVDDLAAIIIIALFYTSDVKPILLAAAVMGLLVLAVLNYFRVSRIAAYLLVGLVIWALVLKSGVHATLAGVCTAAFIPLRAEDDTSPARHLEHILHPWVAYMILPVFAFANAGVPLAGVSPAQLLTGVPLGILLGLALGKQLGVFSLTWLGIRLGWAPRPAGASWGQIYGVSVVTGIGFTMSLFIGSLAFEHGGFEHDAGVRLGVLCASVFSALFGYLVLRFASTAGNHDSE